MFCPRCGKENSENAQLCRFCSQVMSSVSQPPLADARTSGLAIAALVLGILSLPIIIILPVINAKSLTTGAKPDGFDISVALVRGILSPISLIILPSIILGILSLVKINNSAGRLKGTGLAIAGFVTPMVMLSVLSIGSQMYCIAQSDIISKQMERDVKKTEEEVEQMFCKSNLLRLGTVMIFYAMHNNQQFPTPSKWCDILSNESTSYIEALRIRPEMFICKGAKEGPCNYAMNKNMENLGRNAPGDMVLLFETTPGWNQYSGPEILSVENHRGKGCNILFIDGHVEWVKKEDLYKLKWTASDSP
jgi:prepilin-type processing-associated H-X9-DG protein